MARTKWLASLSDGTTAVEGQDQFYSHKGDLSPWQKLKAHLEETGLHITGIRVQVFKTGEATRTYNLPSMHRTPGGNHGRWASLYPVIPDGYDCWRWVTVNLNTGEHEHEIEIRAYYHDRPDVSLIVDEDEGNECWVVPHIPKAEVLENQVEEPA